jgi:hypothetical protein
MSIRGGLTNLKPRSILGSGPLLLFYPGQTPASPIVRGSQRSSRVGWNTLLHAHMGSRGCTPFWCTVGPVLSEAHGTWCSATPCGLAGPVPCPSATGSSHGLEKKVWFANQQDSSTLKRGARNCPNAKINAKHDLICFNSVPSGYWCPEPGTNQPLRMLDPSLGLTPCWVSLNLAQNCLLFQDRRENVVLLYRVSP